MTNTTPLPTPLQSSHVLRPVYSYALIIKSDHLERANKFVGPFKTFEDAQEARGKMEEGWRTKTDRLVILIVAVEHPTDKH